MKAIASKKPKPPTTTQFNMRLPDVLREKLEVLAGRNFTDITAEIITAVREHLTKNNLWPQG